MDANELMEWASAPRPALAEAVASDIRDHLAEIRSRGMTIYGYAIMPGEPPDIRSLVAGYNCASDIPVGPYDDEYAYHKYLVDEWQHMDHGEFSRSARVLTALNSQFAAMHEKDEEDFEIDEFEEAYARSLLGSILDGMASAKAEGLFGPGVEYLAIWISDSDDAIVKDSVRRLSSSQRFDEFMGEFGDAE